ncbi:hypothetical protein Cni_G23401 [Canna indica]|uniref:Uncharacterized protein n=1 Tax=Canna indica TaxID=4628 RepID=A0AAQ3KYG7_9LILI|nr:hypothetical protein Cni_G23401 [Canna indica]
MQNPLNFVSFYILCEGIVNLTFKIAYNSRGNEAGRLTEEIQKSYVEDDALILPVLYIPQSALRCPFFFMLFPLTAIFYSLLANKLRGFNDLLDYVDGSCLCSSCLLWQKIFL